MRFSKEKEQSIINDYKAGLNTVEIAKKWGTYNFRHNLYYLESTKTINVVKFYNLIYNDAHIYLKRKYDKGYLFMETLREKCAKFKEGAASSNPEPSHNSYHKLYNKNNGRYLMEGAETIMRYLNVS